MEVRDKVETGKVGCGKEEGLGENGRSEEGWGPWLVE